VAHLGLLPHPDEPVSSGVYQVCKTLLANMEDMTDIEVSAFTMLDDLPAPIQIRRGAVGYTYLPCRARCKTLTLYRTELRKMRQWLERGQYDVVHAQPTPQYLLAAVECGLPHVLTVHGLIKLENQHESNFSGSALAARVREAMQEKAVRRADHLIAISDYVESYLTARSGARIWPVANPIAEEFFRIPPPERSGLRILCVGQISERKNQILLLQACKRLKAAGVAFELRLVGQPWAGYDKTLESFVERNGLSADVRMLGRVSLDTLLKEYEWANFVTLPSREESSSLVLLQAMANGRCVAGSTGGALPEVLGHGQYGDVYPLDDGSGLFASMMDFKSGPDRWWARAAVGVEHVAQRYSAGAVARQTVDVYRTICSATGQDG
jgi:glycosyltransferase involved in cell wall biosynthesis